MSLRGKYTYGIETAEKLWSGGSVEEKDGKLYLRGTVHTQNEVNQIWNALKTVHPGDTLSAIAQRELGDAKKYMKIFEANRDQLQDPDKIKPGQVLKIPSV